jgi:hypothetical protein
MMLYVFSQRLTNNILQQAVMYRNLQRQPPSLIKILETRSEESSSADLKSKCKHELHKNDVDMTSLLDSSDRQLVSIYKPRRCGAAALDFRVLNAISSSLPAA